MGDRSNKVETLKTSRGRDYMTSKVRTQGQKGEDFFVPLTADSLHSVANFEVETEDQIRKNGRGDHSTALQLAHPFQRCEVDETTFALLEKASPTCTSGSSCDKEK